MKKSILLHFVLLISLLNCSCSFNKTQLYGSKLFLELPENTIHSPIKNTYWLTSKRVDFSYNVIQKSISECINDKIQEIDLKPHITYELEQLNPNNYMIKVHMAQQPAIGDTLINTLIYWGDESQTTMIVVSGLSKKNPFLTDLLLNKAYWDSNASNNINEYQYFSLDGNKLDFYSLYFSNFNYKLKNQFINESRLSISLDSIFRHGDFNHSYFEYLTYNKNELINEMNEVIQIQNLKIEYKTKTYYDSNSESEIYLSYAIIPLDNEYYILIKTKTSGVNAQANYYQLKKIIYSITIDKNKIFSMINDYKRRLENWKNENGME